MSLPLDQESPPLSPNVLAEPENAPWHPIDRAYVTAERFGNVIFVSVLMVGAIVGSGILFWMNYPPGTLTYVTIAGLLLLPLLLGVFGHVMPMVIYRHVRYRLSTFGFEIERGILWRRRITVPISRVQHTDVAQGPLQRRFSLGKLIVYTAGTQHASIELDGLSFDVASRLRDALVAGRESLDGV